MIYSIGITTDEKGEIASPLKTSLNITAGLVYKVEIEFPPGSAGLMGVSICDGGFQVWPSTIGQWFTGDSSLISFEDIYLKESAPFIFDIFTYNIDTEYPHLVNIRIGLVSKDIFMARFLPHLSYKFFQQMLENLQAEQVKTAEQQRQETMDTPFPWLQETEEG